MDLHHVTFELDSKAAVDRSNHSPKDLMEFWSAVSDLSNG